MIPAMGAERPIFVVGGGPSGLAAAWRLKRAGYDPIVLEERDRVGGQLLTVKRDGFLMEAGTTILPEAYESCDAARPRGRPHGSAPARELPDGLHAGRATMHMLRANRLALDAARTPLLSMRSKLKAGKLALDAFRDAKLLSYEDLSVAGAARLRDARGVREAPRPRRGALRLPDRPGRPRGRGRARERISVVEFFFLWQKVLGSKLYAFREGYSQFPEALAAGHRRRPAGRRGEGGRREWGRRRGHLHGPGRGPDRARPRGDRQLDGEPRARHRSRARPGAGEFPS